MKQTCLFFARLFFLTIAIALPAVAADRINVIDWGAIPNDGGDDSVAIRTALGKGRSIYFPPGTYHFSGTIDLPPTTSYRLYGDGPGISTIAFSPGDPYGYAGIGGVNMGENTLNIDGLTLRADQPNCGTGIYAIFTKSPASGGNFRTATIRNVQIIGSSGGYWNHGGIYLLRAHKPVIDNVEIVGNKNFTPAGITWEADPSEQATGLLMSNLRIKWCDRALYTSGRVEAVVLRDFEFMSCGRNGQYAVDLSTNISGSIVHLVNGSVNSVGNGVRIANQNYNTAIP